VTLVITTLAIVVRSKGEVEASYDISMKAAREMAAAGVDRSCSAAFPSICRRDMPTPSR
jgi:hypothetical protein